MQELVFTNKEFRTTFSVQGQAYPNHVNKPMLCPRCGAYVDSTKADTKLFSMSTDPHYGFVKYTCTHCKKPYIVAYEIDYEHKSTKFSAFFPSMSAEFENERLANVSPRFISYYNQAMRAELAGDIELAATGYRMSLECLVKDYAINELGRDRNEVSRKTLYEAIGEYLGERDLISTADVVRILGNDYTHYERRYPEHDFPILKSYMEIFIRLIDTKIMIAHPPLGR